MDFQAKAESRPTHGVGTAYRSQYIRSSGVVRRFSLSRTRRIAARSGDQASCSSIISKQVIPYWKFPRAENLQTHNPRKTHSFKSIHRWDLVRVPRNTSETPLASRDYCHCTKMSQDSSNSRRILAHFFSLSYKHREHILYTNFPGRRKPSLLLNLSIHIYIGDAFHPSHGNGISAENEVTRPSCSPTKILPVAVRKGNHESSSAEGEAELTT